MKTTIKIDLLKSLVVEPSQCGGVLLSGYLAGVCMGSQIATPDQCGAFIFALEMALEKQAAA